MVAKTILEQLGGGKFIAMTGSRELHRFGKRVKNEPCKEQDFRQPA
jgi:hypothetical protein